MNNANKKNKFEIGDVVYLITDPDKYKRIITAIIQRKKHLEYEVSFLDANCIALDYEITHDQKNIINEHRD
tara:strand:+ start:623 stop:835 length:213 start_codon:yes stop_codon:yes gene_type:complete